MTYRQEYYYKNKEREKETHKIWEQAHPGYRRQWYRDNRDKLIEYAKKRYANIKNINMLDNLSI